ncbi:MAG TPA: archaemetzincin family Zn-dependent metalloprotease [Chitinispirillaceae bacterium]|jgi:archaemetzincin|nr:archaemetzincin family Zn-dependent metalloprotease [Chitinispirillaceae bacterium]
MGSTIIKSPVTLIPFKPFDEELIQWLTAELPSRIGVKVSAGPLQDNPGFAFERRREQYFGDALLAFLREKRHSIGGTLLGLIDQDCYTGNLSFIFGQAVLKGHEAIVATKRLRQSFYGLPENPGLLRERLLKEAMHEIGHTWGLPHCPDPYCVMHFSSSLNDTDIKEAKYCEAGKD